MEKVEHKTDFVIDVKGLSKKFRKQPAVLDVSLQVKPGEIFGFLGPNGTGKTTTIRMLCGLLRPTLGEGYCLGYDVIKQWSQIRSHVGYMTQNFSLYGDLTIYENLVFRAQLYGLIDYKKRLESIIEMLGLGPRRNQFARSLSTGWKQRLSLGAALVHDPLLLLLDEPTAGIDSSARRTFWEVINDLSAQGVTILLSSHNMDEVTRCHRIAYMSYGKLIMTGTISEMIKEVGLVTYFVSGKNLPLLLRQLQALPEVDLVTSYYNELHVCAKDEEKLKQAVKPFMESPQYEWRHADTMLEDVFVYLISKMRDTRYV